MRVAVTVVHDGRRTLICGNGDTAEQAEGDAQGRAHELFGPQVARLEDWRVLSGEE